MSESNVSEPGAVIPAFRVGRFRRELAWGELLRGVLVVAVLTAFLASVSSSGIGAAVGLIGAFAGFGALFVRNVGVARRLPQLGALIERDPAAGESALAELMTKRALPRWVRLTLYHRLAMLRHRQGDYAASSAIAQTLLTTPRPGPAASHRPHLLLLLAEARLELGDAWGAWFALAELARTPLSLTEALQRMALRTRYEVATGRDEVALAGVAEKVRLAELMPAPQCGALHALLLTAAERAEQEAWRGWLAQRVELLGGGEDAKTATLDVSA